MSVLTAAQQKAAKAGVAKMLDRSATVVRRVAVNTTTGKGKTPTTIYAGIPCVLVANTDTAPTTEGVPESPVMMTEVVGYFAPKWRDETGGTDPVAVLLLVDDQVTVDGVAWTVSENMDPQTGTATECVVKLHRNGRQ